MQGTRNCGEFGIDNLTLFLLVHALQFYSLFSVALANEISDYSI